MSRTNKTTPYRRWNIRREEVWHGPAWGSHRGEIQITEKILGTELYDLRYFAGCKRQPQQIHCEIRVWGWESLIAFESTQVKWFAKERRGRVRSREREYNRLVRDLWNTGDEVDDILEPLDSTPACGAILWELW